VGQISSKGKDSREIVKHCVMTAFLRDDVERRVVEGGVVVVWKSIGRISRELRMTG
jgi:hypothetical protein